MNKLKKFAKEHEDEIKIVLGLVGFAALAGAVGWVANDCCRIQWYNKNVNKHPDMANVPLSDFGKIGEKLIEKAPDELNADSKVLHWFIQTEVK